MNILIENATLLTMDAPEGGPRSFAGSLGIKGDRIALVAREGEKESVEQFRRGCGGDLRTIDGRGKIAMPGLINTHNHAAMTLMRGFADDMPLMEWLNDHIWPFEAGMTRGDVQLGSQLAIAEMLLGGTTTYVDMYWMVEAEAEVVEQAGIRAVLTTSVTDPKMDDFYRDSELLLGRRAGGANPLIDVMVAPHAPYTVSPENMRRVLDVARKYDVGVNVHISETLDEQRMVRERYGKTPTEYLDDLGALDGRTIAAHCVHVSDGDIEILRARGVSVAHNPQSNMKLSSGIAPVVKMMNAGVNVAIGTDGPSSNNDLDMWDEMRSASFLQKVATGDPLALPAYETLAMATVNGARAIGKGDSLGRLREGFLADVILIDTRKAHLSPQFDTAANLVYAGKSTDVDTVIVGGRILVEGGAVTGLDLEALCDRAQRRAAEIAGR